MLGVVPVPSAIAFGQRVEITTSIGVASAGASAKPPSPAGTPSPEAIVPKPNRPHPASAINARMRTRDHCIPRPVMADTREAYLALVDELSEHDRRYYVDAAPTISDYEYDLAMTKLRAAE